MIINRRFISLSGGMFVAGHRVVVQFDVIHSKSRNFSNVSPLYS